MATNVDATTAERQSLMKGEEVVPKSSDDKKDGTR
jgi:hypothetical protein